MWLSLALQVATSLAPAPNADSFDLRTLPQVGCAATGNTDEIVVCGTRRDDERFRLRAAAPSRYDTKPDEASLQVGRAKVGVTGQKAELPGGVTSNRALITIKIPF